MVQSQFGLTWDGYKNNLCKGFSALQQNGEFVDMTLAADGHLVKVHQMLVALASPYFKELIQSAPCPHPVIFLNNVNYRTLCSLLEYIYTGEVLVSSDNLSNFIETAKALHILGIDDTVQGACDTSLGSTVQVQDIHGSGINEAAKSLGTLRMSNARRIEIKQEIPIKYTKKSDPGPTNNESYVIGMDDSMHNDPHDDDDDDEDTSVSQIEAAKAQTNLQFTISNRGSLQVILNRYLYNLHSTAHRTGIRRWRCVDYRNKRCLAFIVTKGNVVLNRANLHNHAFHDKKILTKIDDKTIYSAIEQVEGLKSNENDESKDAVDDTFEALDD